MHCFPQFIKFIFSGLTNYKESQIKMLSRQYTQPNMLARKVVPSLPFQAFKAFYNSQNPVSFLIVRHPYERLLSAYRDKFENKKKYYHQNYGKFMISQYRKRGVRRFGRNFYRVDKGSKSISVMPHLRATQRKRGDPTPTFWEFVRTIIDHRISNEHWRPASTMCSLCRVSITNTC